MYSSCDATFIASVCGWEKTLLLKAYSKCKKWGWVTQHPPYISDIYSFFIINILGYKIRTALWLIFLAIWIMKYNTKYRACIFHYSFLCLRKETLKKKFHFLHELCKKGICVSSKSNDTLRQVFNIVKTRRSGQNSQSELSYCTGSQLVPMAARSEA